MHPKPVSIPKIETEAVLRNVVTAIASTLRPVAMFVFPVLRATLLPCVSPPPAALLLPSALLLPRDCLLPRALLLLSLLGPLLCLLLLRPLLLSLLDPLLLWLCLLWLLRLLLLWPPLLSLLDALLLLPLLLLRLLLLPGLLWMLCLLLPWPLLLSLLCPCLRVLLLCGWRRALLSFRLALFFALLVMLRESRDDRPDKQNQDRGTGSSNESHCSCPP